MLLEDVDAVDRLPFEDCEEDRAKNFRLVKRDALTLSEESPLDLKEANIALERMVDMLSVWL